MKKYFIQMLCNKTEHTSDFLSLIKFCSFLKAIYTTEEALGRDGNIFYCPPKLGPIL
jgi:hypothetical protein